MAIAGVRINVAADSAEALDWLETCSYPWKLEEPAARANDSVLLLQDKTAACEIEEAVLSPARGAASVPFYQRRRALRVMSGEGAGFVVPIEEGQHVREVFPVPITPHDEVFVFDPDAVAILTRRERVGPPTILSRVVRDLALKRLLSAGYGQLHASAVVGPAGAVVFSGDKGVGKSTLLLRCLERFECDYLTNDRLLIDPQGRMFNIPIAPVIRLDTLDDVRGLGERIRTGRLEPLYPQHPWWKSSESPSHYKVGFVQAELAASFGADVAAAASMRALFLITRAEGPVSLSQSSQEHEAAAISRQRLRNKDEVFPDPFVRLKARRNVVPSIRGPVFAVCGDDTTSGIIQYIERAGILSVR